MAKRKSSTLLTPEAAELWRALSQRAGLSQSQYLEVLIRADAASKGVTAEPPKRSKPRKPR